MTVLPMERTEALEELRADYTLTVVHCQENSGKGAAIRQGLPYVKGDTVIIQDADMELVPTDLPELLKPLETEEIQVVYGSRFLNEARGMQVFIILSQIVCSPLTRICFTGVGSPMNPRAIKHFLQHS